MNDLVTLGVLPGAAALSGLVLGGPIGGLDGLFLGLGFGLAVLYTGSDADRVGKLERRARSWRGNSRRNEARSGTRRSRR